MVSKLEEREERNDGQKRNRDRNPRVALTTAGGRSSRRRRLDHTSGEDILQDDSRIANVLNYDIVHDGIVRLASGRHFNLQETLVEAILDLCLAQPGVIEARVSTEKPDVYQDCRVGYEAARRRS